MKSRTSTFARTLTRHGTLLSPPEWVNQITAGWSPTIEVQVGAGNNARDVASPVGPGRRELNFSEDLRQTPPKSPTGSVPDGIYGPEKSNGKVVQIQVAGPEGVPTLVMIGEEPGLGSGINTPSENMGSGSGSSIGAGDVAGGNTNPGIGAATGARLPGGRSRIQRVANASSSSIVTVERVRLADRVEVE